MGGGNHDQHGIRRTDEGCQAAYHRLRQRKGRDRQIDHRGACRDRAGRRAGARVSRRSTSIIASARWGAISTTAPRRASAPAASCRSRATRRMTAKASTCSRRNSPNCPTAPIILVIDTPGRDDPFARLAATARRHAGHADERQLRRFRPDRPGRSRHLQGHAAELLFRADLGRAQGARQGRRRRRSTGSCCATASSISRRATCAACRRRSTSWPSGSVSASSRVSASA